VLGLVGVVGLAVVDWAAWVLVLPARRPGSVEAQVTFETDPAAPERRLGEPIEAVGADGVRLAGLWHPAGRKAGRVVLLIHGFAEDPSTLLARMEALNRHGWDVAALDTRAHGRSGGDRGSFGGREAGDVAAWIDALTGSGRVGDPGAGVVTVWGRSMGAAIALRAAADDPRVAAVVLEAPYLDLVATVGVVLRRKRVPLPRLFAGLVLRRAQALAGVSLTTPRPIDLAPKVNTPALVVHGSDDPLIPLADARRLARAFPRPAEVVEVPGGGHSSIVEVGGAALLDRIAGFLDEATSARG
jgi:alpha-beta hydrolase superfamily lysophospholipase